MKVILQEDNQKLDEVVVVGYGSMKQKNITGSVSTISAEELEDLPVSNLSEALQGMVNGLNVQLGSAVRVRMPMRFISVRTGLSPEYPRMR